MTALHGPKTDLDLPRLEQRAGGPRRGFAGANPAPAAHWLTWARRRLRVRRPARLARRAVGGSAPDLTGPRRCL